VIYNNIASAQGRALPGAWSSATTLYEGPEAETRPPRGAKVTLRAAFQVWLPADRVAPGVGQLEARAGGELRPQADGVTWQPGRQSSDGRLPRYPLIFNCSHANMQMPSAEGLEPRDNPPVPKEEL
jgi:hypothetical protein